MDANFWRKKWIENDIAFHNSEPHPLLVKHLKELRLAAGSRVFVPLCGKTRDIPWLLSSGYRVCGAELSEIAVKQLFADLGMEPQISTVDEPHRYSANDIDIFAGDIFHLSAKNLGPVDAVYDRAALVALPDDMRKRYSTHLMEITGNAPQLLICYEYDQNLMAGPPFAISDDEVKRLYKDFYDLNLIESVIVPGGLKGKAAAKENVWRLGSVSRTKARA